MSDLEQFRQETRAWLEENCPQSMRTPAKGFDDFYSGGRNPEINHPDQKLWCDRMAARGWTVPHWPKEYGGGGLSNEEVKVLSQEMANISARRALNSFGISMLGPALLHFGTEEQKQKFALEALGLRFDTENKTFNVQDFLTPTRKEDEGSDLWSVFNLVQEKLVNGMVDYRAGSKQRKARRIKNFQQDVKLNSELYELALAYAQ